MLTEVVSLDDIRDEVCAAIVPLAEARGLTFTANFKDAPDVFITDPRKLRQVLLNLLGNAVKFTAEGSVTLNVTTEEDELVFTVSDTGPGIRAADRDRVFEPFTQLDQTATRAHGGTGLGLAITRRLAALLGGTVDLDPQEGTGSTFVVRLPYQRPWRAAAPSPRPGHNR